MLLPVLYIHACALSAHTRARVRVSISASATHLWLAATPLSLPELGPLTQTFSVSSYYLHVNMTRQTSKIRDLTGSIKEFLLWYLLECSHVVN